MSRISARNSLLGMALVTAVLAASAAQTLARQPAVPVTLNILYSFQSSDDGYIPAAGITLDSSGNLYSTTAAGGISRQNGGTVFRLSPDGSGGLTKAILYTFQGYRDGSNPRGGVVSDAAGSLYGTTSQGGPFQCGRRISVSPYWRWQLLL